MSIKKAVNLLESLVKKVTDDGNDFVLCATRDPNTTYLCADLECIDCMLFTPKRAKEVLAELKLLAVIHQ